MALKLTPLELEIERVLCNSIFLKYSDYHLNAATYGLMSEDQYLYDCMYLNALEMLLNKYRYNGLGVFFIGGVEIDQAGIIRVIDFIHHYDKEQITVTGMNFSGSVSSSNSYLWLDVFKEFAAETDNTHIIVVNEGYTPVQVFLNGLLISVSDWTYTGQTLTYTGDIALQVSDWFAVHFKKTS